MIQSAVCFSSRILGFFGVMITMALVEDAAAARPHSCAPKLRILGGTPGVMRDSIIVYGLGDQGPSLIAPAWNTGRSVTEPRIPFTSQYLVASLDRLVRPVAGQRWTEFYTLPMTKRRSLVGRAVTLAGPPKRVVMIFYSLPFGGSPGVLAASRVDAPNFFPIAGSDRWGNLGPVATVPGKDGADDRVIFWGTRYIRRTGEEVSHVMASLATGDLTRQVYNGEGLPGQTEMAGEVQLKTKVVPDIAPFGNAVQIFPVGRGEYHLAALTKEGYERGPLHLVTYNSTTLKRVLKVSVQANEFAEMAVVPDPRRPLALIATDKSEAILSRVDLKSGQVLKTLTLDRLNKMAGRLGQEKATHVDGPLLDAIGVPVVFERDGKKYVSLTFRKLGGHTDYLATLQVSDLSLVVLKEVDSAPQSLGVIKIKDSDPLLFGQDQDHAFVIIDPWTGVVLFKDSINAKLIGDDVPLVAQNPEKPNQVWVFHYPPELEATTQYFPVPREITIRLSYPAQ